MVVLRIDAENELFTCLDATAWKVSKYAVISGPYFPVFGFNTEIYEVNLRIQSEYRKIRTRNNSVFGHFSCSVQNIVFLPFHIWLCFDEDTAGHFIVSDFICCDNG